MTDPTDILTRPQNGHTIELYPDRRWLRMEVDGHYLGEVEIFSGVICLQYRGKRQWYSLADERHKALTATK